MLHIIIYVVMTNFFLFFGGKSHLKDEDRLFCKKHHFLFNRKPLYNIRKRTNFQEEDFFVCFL